MLTKRHFCTQQCGGLTKPLSRELLMPGLDIDLLGEKGCFLQCQCSWNKTKAIYLFKHFLRATVLLEETFLLGPKWHLFPGE